MARWKKRSAVCPRHSFCTVIAARTRRLVASPTLSAVRCPPKTRFSPKILETRELIRSATTDPRRFERGYEWWLAKEAVKRNPQITLATLAWCAPPWITLGEADGYYSPAGLQYHLDFYRAARDVHHLNISYVGVWNESPWSSSYIKSLRHALDSAGFADTKIIERLERIGYDLVRYSAALRAAWNEAQSLEGTASGVAGLHKT